ncbi:MAG: dihydrodipicolinate synthase family protein [Rhodospirillales bacterium]
MSDPNAPSGIYAAVSTPFNARGEVDTGRLANHAHWLLRNGCDGLGVLGTTGEANSLTMDERRRVVDDLVAAGIAPERLMPGTGCCALADTVALTRHALAAGVTSVLMLPPFFYKNNSDEGLVAAYSSVIEAVNDPRLKVLLYHFPQMSGVPVTQGVARALVDRYPGVVVGMKDSSGDLEAMTAMMDAVPELAMFPGSERLLGDAIKRVAGCITAGANVEASLIRTVWDQRGADAINAADLDIMVAVNLLLREYGLFAPIKALLARNYDDPEWRNIRPPLMQLSDERRRELFAAFDATGYTLPAAA